MAEEETPQRRRPVRGRTTSRPQRPRRSNGTHEEPGSRQEPDDPEPVGARGNGNTARRRREGGTVRSVGAAARDAVQQVAALTGHDQGSVISIEGDDDGWRVGVEVVETHRIPDSADILASYEVQLDAGGELVAYRRTRRYARGQMDRGNR